jgi:ribosomal protein L29
MIKPSPETIKALMDSVRQNSTSSLKEQIDALEQGVLDLEAQLAASQTENAEIQELLRLSKNEVQRQRSLLATERRAVSERDAEIVQLKTQLQDQQPARATFEADPTFDPATLTGKEQEMYTRTWSWLGTERRGIDRMLAGRGPIYNEPYPGGVIHMKAMRNVQTYTHTLLILLWLYGDPKALVELIRIWPPLVARTRTDYDVAATNRTREQPGIKRWIYHENKEWAGTGAGFLGSDDHPLEFSLISGTIAESEYALYQNIKHGAGAAYLILSDYVTNHFQKRLEYLSAAYYPNKPLWTYGKALRHPTESQYNYHYFRFLLHGNPVDKEAYEFFGNALRGDREIIDLADGTPVLAQPHGVIARVAQQSGKVLHGGHQSSTYIAESNPHMLIAYWAGSPFHSRDELAAMGHTVFQCVLCDGADKDTVAMTIGGAAPIGDSTFNGKRLIRTRDGKTYPSRWLMGQSEQRRHALVLQRDLAMMLTYLTGRDSYKAEIEALDKRATHERHGGAIGLLLFEAKRR